MWRSYNLRVINQYCREVHYDGLERMRLIARLEADGTLDSKPLSIKTEEITADGTVTLTQCVTQP